MQRIRSILRVFSAASLAIVTASVAFAANPSSTEAPGQGRFISTTGSVLPARSRIEPVNRALEERLETLLPSLMRETGIDMWLVLNREYAEDPVYFSLVPEPVFAARRTTMLVFHDRGEEHGVDRLTVNRYPLGHLYEAAWEGGDLDEQWARLGEIVRERDPRKIGLDISRHWPVADGLTASLRERFEQSVGSEMAARIVSAENLVVRWLETRSEVELATYPHIVGLARSVISEAFSSKVITPGVTTTEDVAWFIRQRYTDLNLPIWFMPDVNVQRAGSECTADSPFCGDDSTIIHPGDVLHTDVGICYLRLCTDTQEMGYVLQPGESSAPVGLEEALASGNRWQDLVTGEFVTGRTGNEILAAARQTAQSEEMVHSIYTHPIGFFGHAPGPTIGMWDNQGDTPIRGDWPLHVNTAYAIEGNIKSAVPEWDGQLVQIKLEQSAVFDGNRVVYLAGRQTKWHLIE